MKTPMRLTLILIALLVAMTAGTALAKKSEHGFLGVRLQDISGSMATALQLDEDEGVLINEVVDDGPAAKAGLKDGDVILKFNGETIGTYSDLNRAVRATAPGDEVDVEILHNGKRQTARIEMGEAKGKTHVWVNDDEGSGDHKVIVMSGDGDDFTWSSDDGDDIEVLVEMLGAGSKRGYLGVELDDLNEQLGDYFGVKDGEGALISVVKEDSPAAAAGFKAGDVIVAVNGEQVDDSDDVHRAMADTEPEQEIEVKVVRKGKNKTVKVTLGEAPATDFKFGRHMMHAPGPRGHFGNEFVFPENFDHDLRVRAPHAMARTHELRLLHEDENDLAEVHEELDRLKEELQELKKALDK